MLPSHPCPPRYFDWVTAAPGPAALLLERSSIYAMAKCYLQASSDGGEAVAQLLAARRAGAELARAYTCQGLGRLACTGHEDRRPVAAAACFLKALDQDPGLERAKTGLEEAVKDITKEAYDKVAGGWDWPGLCSEAAGHCTGQVQGRAVCEMREGGRRASSEQLAVLSSQWLARQPCGNPPTPFQVCMDVFNEGSDADGCLCHPEALGFVDGPRKAGNRLFRVDATLAFAKVCRGRTGGLLCRERKWGEGLGSPGSSHAGDCLDPHGCAFNLRTQFHCRRRQRT